MHMLTEGLKLAAGRALEGLLERGTATPLRGLGAGMTMTALVQSSTAVTVASIGFVNTGLLSLQNAMWVIFGSNVGTTLNATHEFAGTVLEVSKNHILLRNAVRIDAGSSLKFLSFDGHLLPHELTELRNPLGERINSVRQESVVLIPRHPDAEDRQVVLRVKDAD